MGILSLALIAVGLALIVIGTVRAREPYRRYTALKEQDANIARYEQQMEAAYALDERLGIDVVKSGYVTDGGTAVFANADGAGVHFGFTDSQDGVNHELRAVREAAKHHLAVDTHEPVKDTGLRRTWPNWMSREGGRGAVRDAIEYVLRAQGKLQHAIDDYIRSRSHDPATHVQ